MYQLAARLRAARRASSCCTGISGAIRLGGTGALDPVGPPLAGLAPPGQLARLAGQPVICVCVIPSHEASHVC